MIGQDYTDLIADARVWPRDGVSKGPLINALADAIEALVKERDDERATRTANNHLARRVVDALRTRPGWVEPDKTPEGFGSMNFAEVVLREVGRIERERDELAAVIEKARNAIGSENAWDGHARADQLDGARKALSTAPADALREHDAALIEKVLKDLWTEIHVQRFAADSHAADIPGVVKTNVNTFYAGVVRARSMVDSARARQVREGEA